MPITKISWILVKKNNLILIPSETLEEWKAVYNIKKEYQWLTVIMESVTHRKMINKT